MKKIIYYILLLVSIAALAFSSYKIINWYINTKKSNETKIKVKNAAKVKYDKEDKIKFMSVDFSELTQMNNETVGYIKVPGTTIDYSVVKHDDNSYYLYRSFDKSYNVAGWIFLDYKNDLDNLNKNTIIYGHSMKDGSMFHTLRNIHTEEYLNNNKNHYIYISTPKYNYVFEIFSAYYLSPTDDYIKVSFIDENEYADWLKMISERSVQDYGVKATKEDKILTLSSCWSSYERMAVHAKLIKTQVRKN